MAGKTVLILGGGTGGAVASNRLRRMLGKEHRVVLVDRSPLYSFAPSYPWVMLGRRDARRITRDLRKLSRKRIEFLTAEVTEPRPAEKKVALEKEEIAYDYLIVALGALYSAEEVPGLERAYTFYHLDGAEGLRDRLTEFRGGRIAVLVSGLPYKCPPAPYEGAFLLEDYFRRRRLEADVHLYTPETTPPRAGGGHRGPGPAGDRGPRGAGP